MYVRRCFDSLFYFMSLLQHHIKNTLILPEDVEFPLNYYIPLLAQLRPVVDRYLEAFDAGQAQAFLERYPAWTAAAEAGRATNAKYATS